MKIPVSSKHSIVTHENELVSRFHEMLRGDQELNWRILPGDPDDAVALDFDVHPLTFHPIYRLRPDVRELDSLKLRETRPPLLVAPRLSSRVLEACRERDIAAMDLNGRAWLRSPGLLVARSPDPGRDFHANLEPVALFADKSARIIRCLLTDRDRIWTQREIIFRTQASPALLSRIVRHLLNQGFLEKTGPRNFKLKDSLALLDTWVDSDRMPKRTRTVSCAGFLGSPLELARRLQSWAHDGNVPLVFTQWTAAWARHPFTEPVVCSAYVTHFPDTRTLDQLGLRVVNEGGKLQLYVPVDGGIFRETRTVDGLTLTTDAQIYLDLQRTGLRGPEAAASLREWDDFCRS